MPGVTCVEEVKPRLQVCFGDGINLYLECRFPGVIIILNLRLSCGFSQAVAFCMVRRTALGNCAFGRGNGFIVARHRLPAGVEAAEMLWADDTFRPGAALGRGGSGRYPLMLNP